MRLDDDAEFIVDAVRRHLNPAADMSRFDWLYRGNPDGEAQAWIAEDGASGKPIGIAAAFPRRIYLHGRVNHGWVLGDFCVDGNYRTLGPALQLQRACLAGIAATGAGIAYDLPGGEMSPLYRRLGIAPFGLVRRLAKPLRVDGRVPPGLPSIVRAPLSRAGNDLLALLDARHGVAGDVDVAFEAGPCGPEYSELATRVASGHSFCLQRAPSYLDWRYLHAPHRRYRLLAARRRGELVGYAVLDRDGEVGWIVDLFGIEDGPAIRSLVAAAVACFREERAATVAVAILDGHPWIADLTRLGFSPREATPVVVCTGDGRALTPEGARGGPWLFVQGDRES
ncbi:MAG: hypothetical protein ACREM3_28325 [Candidatus Rokuibacteriota bacterium]